MQKISHEEFERSLDGNVPGMSKRNTIRLFALPDNMPSEFEVAKKGFSSKAQRFLKPPVRLFGVPAMRRLADEILSWNDKRCFEHMVIYAATPPSLPRTFENSHGMRFWQASVLEALGVKYRISKWSESSRLFKQSGERIIDLCEAALRQNRQEASKLIDQIANLEEKAYEMLRDVS